MKGRTGANAFAMGALIVGLGLGLGLAAPALAADCAGARPAGASKLTVQVNGVRSTQGEVAITVYPAQKKRFLAKGGKVARERVPAATSVRACFWLPAGAYAVAIYHDKDGDRDFDRTVVGLPAEGFGFSNDPETKIGLPPLSQVRFALAGDKTIAIQTKYLK